MIRGIESDEEKMYLLDALSQLGFVSKAQRDSQSNQIKIAAIYTKAGKDMP